MMHDREKSDSAIVAAKPTNKAATAAAEPVAKDGGRGEREPAKHAPDTGPETRDTGAGAHTTSREAQEEGEVHCASAPRQCRSATGVVLRARTQGRLRRGWVDMAELCSRP